MEAVFLFEDDEVIDNLIMIFSELSNETNNYQIKFKNIIEDLVELNDKMELTLIDINNKLDEEIKHYESLTPYGRNFRVQSTPEVDKK